MEKVILLEIIFYVFVNTLSSLANCGRFTWRIVANKLTESSSVWNALQACTRENKRNMLKSSIANLFTLATPAWPNKERCVVAVIHKQLCTWHQNSHITEEVVLSRWCTTQKTNIKSVTTCHQWFSLSPIRKFNAAYNSTRRAVWRWWHVAWRGGTLNALVHMGATVFSCALCIWLAIATEAFTGR